jgi:hypothetical protein
MSQRPGLLGTPREWAIDLAVVTVVGVFLGFIGPYGSFNDDDVVLRVAYWVANMWTGYVILTLVVRLSLRIGARADLPDWFALIIGLALGCLPLAAAITALSMVIWPRAVPAPLDPRQFLIHYAECLGLALPCGFGLYYLDRRSWPARDGVRTALIAPDPGEPGCGATLPTRAVAPSAGAFLERLPPRLGQDLLCLQMEDHYVRAHTDRGSDLVLTPLRQAIAELGETEGLQVHRSWWVAKDAVAEVRTQGRALQLRLRNGLEVPVSRASVAKLKASGWLPEA